ncbi:MAG: nuclear transport factor 2 family protein [Ilumatobacter sp.]|jgi:predicted SnoaL-like aldol condensation-catalyzing enzyme|uniref:nuclear transport factor 2 family protein n=1 Tax=Ilumatobacter sp. TaxID=1967498 RepID=UPI00391D206F
MKILTPVLVASAIAVAACSDSTPTAEQASGTEPTETTIQEQEQATMTTTELATATLAALFIDFDPDAAAELLAPDYIQHNTGVPTGAAPVLEFIPALEESGISVTTHRVFTDGDLVVFHNTYENAELFGAPTLVAFDVFRIENGKVAEHWDNLQPPAEPNASGRTLTDGPTEVTDLDQTEANKALVAEFTQAVLIDGDFDRITEFMAPDLIQHNPWWGDGLEALGAGFAAQAEQGNALRYDTVHQIIGQGNFVLFMSEGALGDTPTAYYDLLRLDDGKIVEHWDVISEIPAEMAHDNGKF